MSLRTLTVLVFVLPLLFSAGCYCPLMAKAGYEQECEGYMVDNLDGKSFRFAMIKQGKTQSHGISLNISRKDCSIALPKSLETMGVIHMGITKPRSAKEAAMSIAIRTGPGEKETIQCTAPLSDTDPMVFTCPTKASDIRYLLEPFRGGV